MSGKTHFVVGTRASLLATTQTNQFLNELKQVNSKLTFEIKTIVTSGDLGLLQELGAFTKEVEIALLKNEIDFAIHSLKDLPIDQPEGLTLAAMLKRGDVRDCLISTKIDNISNITESVVLGTTSKRRTLQIKNLNKSIETKDFNGNIVSRIDKMESGQVDGVILALAGIQRIDLQNKVKQIFSIEEIVPAVAQGILVAECRKEDDQTITILQSVDDANTRFEANAEREFLKALGGGCRMPMGANLNYLDEQNLSFHYFYADESSEYQTKGVFQCKKDEFENNLSIVVDKILAKI